MQKERNAPSGAQSASGLQNGKVKRATPTWLLVTACAALIQACSPAASGSRYPEKKRPEPARSASDGEILGAQRQSPEDTLEGSLTNEHAAPNPRDEQDAEKKSLEPEPCVEPRADGTLPATTPSGIPTQRRCPLKPQATPAAGER